MARFLFCCALTVWLWLVFLYVSNPSHSWPGDLLFMLTWSGREQMKAGHQLFTLGQAPDKQPAKDTTTTLTEALVVSRALPALPVPPHHSPVAEEQGPDAHREHAVACKRRRLPARHGPSRTPPTQQHWLSVKYLLVLPSSTGACPSSATSP